MTSSSQNSLGLDFTQDPVASSVQESGSTSSLPPSDSQQVKADDDGQQADPEPTSPVTTSPSDANEKKTETAKKKPYVNPERVLTGGNQRDKLSEEALNERMVRMREQNEKIKARRMDVQADEMAFIATQESERQKQANARKVQASVDHTREQNAKRKMDKVLSREWDSGKPHVNSKEKDKQATPNWKEEVANTSEKEKDPQPASPHTSPIAPTEGGWARGGSPRGSRGRGRGGGRGAATSPKAPGIVSPNIARSKSGPISPKPPTLSPEKEKEKKEAHS